MPPLFTMTTPLILYGQLLPRFAPADRGSSANGTPRYCLNRLWGDREAINVVVGPDIQPAISGEVDILGQFEFLQSLDPEMPVICSLTPVSSGTLRAVWRAGRCCQLGRSKVVFAPIDGRDYEAIIREE
jgi:hypothetical protein